MNKVFRLSSLIFGIIFFAVFMTAACVAYYLTAGVFVNANLAALYAVLGALGAFAIMFRRYLFAGFFYTGCALGWLTGHYVSTLKGEFAPTAGVIATFFLIGAFSLVGLILEWGLFKRRRRKKAEQREAERQAEERRQLALIAEQQAKAAEARRAAEETKNTEEAERASAQQ